MGLWWFVWKFAYWLGEWWWKSLSILWAVSAESHSQPEWAPAAAQLLWCVCACSSRIFLQLGGTRPCPVSAVQPSPPHPPALLWWIPGAIQLTRSKCNVLKGNITFQCFTHLFAVFWFVFPLFFLFPAFRYFSVQPPCLTSPVTLHNSFSSFCSFEVVFFLLVLGQQSDACHSSDQCICSVQSPQVFSEVCWKGLLITSQNKPVWPLISVYLSQLYLYKIFFMKLVITM